MNKTDVLSADLLGELTATAKDVGAVRQAEPVILDFFDRDDGALLGNAHLLTVQIHIPCDHFSHPRGCPILAAKALYIDVLFRLITIYCVSGRKKGRKNGTHGGTQNSKKNMMLALHEHHTVIHISGSGFFVFAFGERQEIVLPHDFIRPGHR